MTDSPQAPGAGGSAPTLASAAAELYSAPPQEFTQRRKDLAAAARAAGDREVASQITALRKPTRAAWVVNRLARAEPGTAASLADLAAGLRAATAARDGRRLRDLSARRRALIDSLTDQALFLAELADAPPALREEVTATLAAALADPEVAAQLAAGTLTRAATWSGFGFAAAGFPAEPPPSAESSPGQLTAEPPPGQPADEEQPSAAGPPPPVPPVRLPPQARRTLTPPPQAGQPPPSPIPEAERAVADAATLAAAAAAAEERLEVRVRDLEQQLTTVRADLAAARRKARRAESAERRARQALNRLQAKDEQ
ncbi:MAG TPA: hypothetical protein VMU95_15225 [Trebonia sp.]|nr:hypothetical protein [Trebonia sp.]